MKAKRLTALALAALMAASTTSVALAGEKVSNDLDFAKDGKYYKYDPDDNRLEAVAKDSFQPGDDVYILLKDGAESFSSKKTYNAYGSWAIGESWVKDIDVVYRKGDISTLTNYSVEYTLNGVKYTDVYSSNDKAAYIKSLQDKVDSSNAMVIAYINENYSSVEGYIYGSKIYPSLEAAIKAAGVTIQTETVYSYNGNTNTNKDTLMQGVSASPVSTNGYELNGLYYGDEITLLKYSNTGTISDAASVEKTNAGSIYIKPTDVTEGYGVYSDTSSGEYNTAASTQESLPATFFTYTVGGTKYWATADGLIKALNAAGITVVHATAGDYYVSPSAGADQRKIIRGSEIKSTVTTTYTGNNFTATNVQDVYNHYGINQTKTSAYILGKNVSLTDAGAEFQNNVQDVAINAVKSAYSSIDPKFTANSSSSTQYEYWVKISTKDSATTKDIDVVGTISVGTSKSSAEKDGKLSIDFTLTNANTDNDGYFDDVDSDITIEDGERAVVSFSDDAEDLIIEFGDDAWFEFNARGQGKLNLAYNTKFNREFAYDYDDANIDFINFVAEPTTNRTGTLYIYADEDSYIYEVTSKGAKKINGAYYDDDEGAWVIRTRHLTSYAISDRRLKTIDQMEDDKNSSSSSKPSGSQGSGSGNGNYKPIPDTGR